jgi:ascorbate-specific PTS system EIIC-type component UlaA
MTGLVGCFCVSFGVWANDSGGRKRILFVGGAAALFELLICSVLSGLLLLDWIESFAPHSSSPNRTTTHSTVLDGLSTVHFEYR